MNVSKLIERLKADQEKYGDLEVKVYLSGRLAPVLGLGVQPNNDPTAGVIESAQAVVIMGDWNSV